MGDIFENLEYGLNAPAEPYDGENGYIRITDIDDSSHLYEGDDRVSPGINLADKDEYLLKEGDILFARTGASVGKTYKYRDSDGRLYYAGFLIRGHVKPQYAVDFIFENTLTDNYLKFVQVTSQRSGQPGINAAEYSDFKISVPCMEEQETIGSFFNKINELITLHQRKPFEKCDVTNKKNNYLEGMIYMENIKSIEARLWEMANKLRGSMDASEYKNYILGFLFYMFLSKKQERFLVDEQLLEVEPDQTPNQAYLEVGKDPEVLDEYIAELVSSLGYAILPQNTWATLVEKIANGQVIASDYQALFDAFNKSTQENKEAEKDFKGIFNDMNLGDSRLGTTTVDRARALGKIVDLVNEVSLDTDSDEDVLGHIYEYLIGQFAANAGKKGGEYYTPHEVSQIMARIVTDGVHLKDESFTVYDPACGSGSLLLTVGSYLEHGNKKGAIKYYGQELNTTTYNIARMNLLMHDVDYQDMKMSNKDTLREDWPDGKNANGIDEPRSFDAVVANPPYSAKWSSEETLMRDPRFKDFGKLAPKSKADFAFLLHGLYHLNSTGTMAIVLPHGVLFRGAAEGTIRKTLIDKNLIDTVIGLPANLFYGTSIPTMIMVLKRNKTDRNILIIDASKYFKKAKNKNILTEEDIDRILKAYRERKDIDKFARVVPFSEIQENDYNLNIPRYVDTSEEEPEIDLKEVLENIRKDDEEIAELSKKLNEQLRILGVINEDINL